MRRLWLLLACMLTGAAHAQVIQVGGSSTVGAFIELAKDAYRAEHPGVLIELAGGGSDAGLTGIRDGVLDIGLMSRDPTEQELAELRGVARIPVGLDAVAVVISDPLYHQGLHVLGKDQIADIFAGHISNWKQVGGPDREILVVDEIRAHGTRQVFAKFFFGDAMIANFAGSIVVAEHQDMETLLLASDQAIGFLPFSRLSDLLHGLDIADAGKVHHPAPEEVRAGDYPLARRLWLLVRKDAPEVVRSFVAFLRSEQGEALLQQAGYLPLPQTGDFAGG